MLFGRSELSGQVAKIIQNQVGGPYLSRIPGSLASEKSGENIRFLVKCCKNSPKKKVWKKIRSNLEVKFVHTLGLAKTLGSQCIMKIKKHIIYPLSSQG